MSADGLNINSSLIVVAVSEEAGQQEDWGQEGAPGSGSHVVLASAIVGVELLGVATSSLPDGAVIWTTLPVLNMSAFGRLPRENVTACAPMSLLGTLPRDEQTCVAGCCRDGTCACRAGYLGSQCELHPRCVLSRAGTSVFDDGRSCVTLHSELHAGHLICGCTELGVVAALYFRMTPPVNAIAPTIVEHAPELLSLEPQRWLLPLLTVGFLTSVAVARWLDLRALYMSAESPQLPQWLRPLPTNASGLDVFVSTLVVTLLTRSSILRIYHVYPGFTVFGHVQLVVVLANSITVNALTVGLFLQRDADVCSPLTAVVVTLSVAIGSLLPSLGRLLFRWGNFHDGSLRRDSYYANKLARREVAKAHAGVLNHVIAQSASPTSPKNVRRTDDGKKLLSSKESDLSSSQGSSCARREQYLPIVKMHAAAAGASPPPSPPPSSQPGALPPTRDHDVLLQAVLSRPTRRKPARPVHAIRVQAVDPADLSADPTGYPAIGVLLTQPAGGATAFVPATDIGRRRAHDGWCGADSAHAGALRVELEASVLDATLAGRPWDSNLLVRQSDPPKLPLWPAGWRAVLAWAVNLAMLLTAFAWLMLILLSLYLWPSQLHANAYSHEEWLVSFQVALCLSLASSFLVIDGVKVALLTLLSLPKFEAALQGRVRAKLLRKPLRRLHKVLDVIL